MNALIVDDNPDNRYLLEVLLREHGHGSVLAGDGVEALAALERHPVDLILSDILMPKMDGYKLCRLCKRDPRFRDIPFLFITAAYTDEKDEHFAEELGADGFIRRPVDPESVLQAVEDAMHRAGHRARGMKDDASYLARYAERVVSNLEKKVRALEEEMAARKRAEDALREREELLRLIAETIEDVFWLSTPGVAEMRYVSPSYERLWERSCESLYRNPRSFLEAVHPDDRPGLEKILQLHASGRQYQTEYRIIRRDGEVRWMYERGFPVRDAEGKLTAMTGVVSDVTQRKRLEHELEHQARTDSLTGIANRRYFLLLAREAIGLSRRYGRPLSLLMLDIDRFKTINDRYGHHVGDLVLKALVKATDDTLRDVDVVGRIGGEEFAVLLPETDTERALRAAERLRTSVSSVHLAIENADVHITASIGVATLKEADETLDAVLKRADKALYEAKAAGRNAVRTIDPA